MRLLFLLFLFCCSTASCEIVEIKSFKEIHSHLASDTIIILDIDDTLLVPVQMLGCDEWFQSRKRFHQQAGFNPSQSLEKSLAEWEAVRHLSKMKIVEPDTDEIVRKLQEDYYVMGLTTQGLALATRTQQQLIENQINLIQSAPSRDDYYLMIDGQGVLFRTGILFTAGAHKGKALFSLFEKLAYKPKCILFINDKRSHLLDIEETAKEQGVAFIGLRYAYSDAYKEAFDAEIAHFQFTHSTFTHILSDEEARKQLNDKLNINSGPSIKSASFQAMN